MNNTIIFKTGKTMFAIALIGMGALHLTSGHFLFDFPVPPTFMGGTIPAYVNGVLLIAAGVLMLTKKQALIGALLAAFIFLAFFVVRHIPLLIMWENMPGERTSATECVLFFGGALMLAGLILKSRGTQQRGHLLFIIGEYAFGTALFVFGILHYVSEAFVVSVIPKWIPWKEFWAYFVMTGFFAAGISIFIQRLVRLSSLLVSLMFLGFICLMHIPLVIAFPGQESQWTNLFVPIGLSGIALMLAGATAEKRWFAGNKY
jgi:putative oxidoreductase